MKPASDELTPDGGERARERPDLEQLMTARTGDHEDVIIVTVEGEIDGLTAPRLRTVLAEAFDRLDGRVLVVDLTRVGFLGSAGLRTLGNSATEAVRHRGFQPLRIVVDESRPVIRPIEIVGLDQMLALYHTVTDALTP
ncbi:MAG TPA: anti-sigma factor antagonist [Amycolatopsis sp.]|uniref:anti-sigma factor antagonist n=1 Tax=Amycolatopsis sp. TaxID=37632 RepID=UPI002B4682D8|nr:anti-sigma factor antagonist [Amycolatopsis sp.]HKS44066.1 anti-sigma factor antagonist [Amycolatopsis sp.]